MYDIINTEHKARKPHTCCLCGCPIEKGEQYIRQFQQEDRCTIKMHKDCFGLLSELSEQEDYEDGVSSEDFVTEWTIMSMIITIKMIVGTALCMSE